MLDDQFRAEYRKPPDKRDFETLLLKYQALRITDENNLGPYVQDRVARIKLTLATIANFKKAQRLIEEAKSAHQNFQTELDRIIAESGSRRVRYTAEGILVASEIYPGSAAIPQRFALRAPKGLVLIAYVQAASGAPPLGPYAGKSVAIVGERKYDTECGVGVIEAREIIETTGKVMVPAPPMPTVEPPKAPPPKKTAKPKKRAATTSPARATKTPPPKSKPAETSRKTKP